MHVFRADHLLLNKYLVFPSLGKKIFLSSSQHSFIACSPLCMLAISQASPAYLGMSIVIINVQLVF